MSKCDKCGGEAQYHFRALEVQTLHVRDFTGEKRVQALGKIQDFSVCADCARQQLDRTLHPAGDAMKKCIIYAAVCIAGIALTVLFHGDNAFRILGPAAVICGLLGVFSTVRTAAKGKESMQSLGESEAMEEAAWQAALSQAPKKWEDSDLTYIPITPKTLAMKNGDLMIVYDLLPDIAVKAHKLIHGKEDSPAE